MLEIRHFGGMRYEFEYFFVKNELTYISVEIVKLSRSALTVYLALRNLSSTYSKICIYLG